MDADRGNRRNGISLRKATPESIPGMERNVFRMGALR